jgi:hypothetical protein
LFLYSYEADFIQGLLKKKEKKLAWSFNFMFRYIELDDVLSHADCLLKNTFTKDNKYVVNQKLEHVDDISFRELFGRIRVAFHKIKSVPSLGVVWIRCGFWRTLKIC